MLNESWLFDSNQGKEKKWKGQWHQKYKATDFSQNLFSLNRNIAYIKIFKIQYLFRFCNPYTLHPIIIKKIMLNLEHFKSLCVEIGVLLKLTCFLDTFLHMPRLSRQILYIQYELVVMKCGKARSYKSSKRVQFRCILGEL